MLKRLVAIFLGLQQSACHQADQSQTNVIGGEAANRRPYMVSLLDQGNQKSPFCGGSLIASNMVLTAAHCVDEAPNKIKIAIGLQNRGEHSSANLVGVKAVKVHEQFNRDTMDNDVALLLLEDYDSIALGDIKPISVSTDMSLPERLGSATVIGWGNATSVGDLLIDELQEVTLPVIPTELCRSAEGYENVGLRQICAAPLSGGKDSCQGDSGGPLVVLDETGAEQLVGVVSWGLGCAQRGSPGVYSRVAAFSAWIEDTRSSFLSRNETIDDLRAGELFRRYCYTGMEETQSIETSSGNMKLSRRYSLEAGTQFALGDQKLSPVTIKHPSESSCQFGEGDRFLIASAHPLENDAQKFEIRLEDSQMGKHFVAPAAVRESLSSWCAIDSNAAFVTVTGDKGYVYAPDRSFYQIESKTDLPTGDSKPLFSCIIGENSWELIPIVAGGEAKATVLRIRSATLGIDIAFQARLQDPDLPSDAPDDGEGTISGVFLKDSEASGQFFLINDSLDDLFSWELSCNFDMTLTTSDGRESPSTVRDERYAWRFLAPANAEGTVRSRQTAIFKYLLPQADLSPEQDRKCQINGLDVPVRFASDGDDAGAA